MAKRQGQSVNKQVANLPVKTGKPATKSLKNGGPNFKVALPRGLYLFSKINDLRESGTANRFMMFQGFLDRVSH
jgi:hypothetical protein